MRLSCNVLNTILELGWPNRTRSTGEVAAGFGEVRVTGDWCNNAVRRDEEHTQEEPLDQFWGGGVRQAG